MDLMYSGWSYVESGRRDADPESKRRMEGARWGRGGRGTGVLSPIVCFPH